MLKNLILTNYLHEAVPVGFSQCRLIAMRPLDKKEVEIARQNQIERYYLPSLTEAEETIFFNKFDIFWNQFVSPFDEKHSFWRNVISSKMQEWERSAAYFALILYTIETRINIEKSESILFLCSSIEEEEILETWGNKADIQVFRRSKANAPKVLRVFIQKLLNFRRFLAFSVLSFYKKMNSPTVTGDLNVDDKTVLIASQFYCSSVEIGKYGDPFFGDLHCQLSKNGYSTVYLSSPLNSYAKASKKAGQCKQVRILLPLSLISWPIFLVILLKLLLRKPKLKKTEFNGIDFTCLMERNYCRYDGGFGFGAEFFYEAMTKLCKKNTFDRLIQLYEGNVFERACIQGFREFNNNPVIGYSHAVVYPINIKIRNTDGERGRKPDPDRFICTGIENQKLLLQIGKHQETQIDSGCSLRNIPRFSDKKSGSKGIKETILVALDGVNEAIVVLDWIFENAPVLKNYKFRVRSHPNVLVESLLAQSLGKKPVNVEFSEGSLSKDLSDCFCVIYRQTSIGIQALLNGIPIIHLRINAPLPCDPLIGFEGLKWSASAVEELVNAIEKIEYFGGEDYSRSVLNAKKYSHGYFTPANPQNIDSFVH